VRRFIADYAATPEQKRAALKAAEAVDGIRDQVGDWLRRVFWAWLERGYWLEEGREPGDHLPATSPLTKAAIRENYPNMKNQAEAEKLAVAAYAKRVARCAAHLRAGRPREDCVAFVTSKPEWLEAVKRAEEQAA
jgi:hypothetical protein